jgi:hypothetical protein
MLTRLRIVASGLAIFMAFGALAADPPPVPSGEGKRGPRVEVEPREFDFGSIWEGMPAKKTFRIRNTGDEPLTLNLHSSCGCTVPSKPKSPLAPGEGDTFTLTYNTYKLGRARTRVTVRSNDPANQNVMIQVRGEVKPLYRKTPQRASFGSVEQDTLRELTMNLTNNHTDPLELKLRESSVNGPYDVALREITRGREYELKITTRPPLSLGQNKADVVLETGFEPVPTIEIPVRAYVSPKIIVSPHIVDVAPTTTQPWRRSLYIQYPADAPIEIKDIRGLGVEVGWTLPEADRSRPAGTKAYHRVELTLPAFEAIPEEGATIQVFTDDKDPMYQCINVPLRRADAGRRGGGAR